MCWPLLSLQMIFWKSCLTLKKRRFLPYLTMPAGNSVTPLVPHESHLTSAMTIKTTHHPSLFFSSLYVNSFGKCRISSMVQSNPSRLINAILLSLSSSLRTTSLNTSSRLILSRNAWASFCDILDSFQGCYLHNTGETSDLKKNMIIYTTNPQNKESVKKHSKR